jgi:hypothetical protein
MVIYRAPKNTLLKPNKNRYKIKRKSNQKNSGTKVNQLQGAKVTWQADG